ncbi:MAG: hypothetical protein R2848_08925 [Thermomicrobiales bacterium]
MADRISSEEAISGWWPFAMVALGMSLAFQGAGNFQYLSEIAPATNRAGYFATANVVLMFTTPSPGGCLDPDRMGLRAPFGVTAAVALLAVLLSGILVDNRIVASRPDTAARLGRVSFR